MSSSAQTPSIRSFQFDASAVANVRSSVNLFRADVNLTQTLFTMPGRSSEQSLDVDVGVQYQSNVYTEAMLWNLDASTGVLGLGWDMPGTAIVLQSGGALGAGARRYAYAANGADTPLTREPEAPLLFAMPAALAAQLVVGEAVPAEIRRLFGAHGLSLSATALVRAGASPLWEIEDAQELQSFALRLHDAQLLALDGGESYQLESYQFWKILYYPRYERWLVIDETGLRKSFGGLIADAADETMPVSQGNSIEWGVGWTAGEGCELLWTGASGLVRGQKHFATAWNLAVTSNLWGDRVLHAYNEQWPVDPTTGLRPVVEQAVAAPGAAAAGLGYTKACYLTGITDVFGRRAVFTYADKLWDNSSPQAPREYADPHKATPDNTPNAWQDCYETQYLSAIAVTATDGTVLLSAGFVYDPSPDAAGAAAEVANVSTNTGAQYGDSFKRFLTGIEFRSGEGRLASTLAFDYWLDDPSDAPQGASPGAIRRATYPGGASSSWSYTQQFLTSCQRDLTVTPPDGLDASSTPTVWFGPDYAVTLWYDGAATTLTLQLHCWIGRWITWQLDPGRAAIFSDAGGFDPASLGVLANAGCLAVSFQTAGDMQLYLFTKDVARPGQWSPALLDGVATGLNQPTLRYSLDVAQITPPIGGSQFVLVTRMDTTYGRYALDRLTWRWTTGEWTLETTGEGGLPALTHYTWATASGEYYLTVDQTGAVQLSWLEAGLTWREGGRTSLPGIDEIALDALALVPGGNLVAASHLRTDNGATLAYTLYALQWDIAYRFRPVAFRRFSDPQDPSGANPTSWVPEIADNSQIACAGHMLRFNGEGWMENSALSLPSVPSGQQQRYAYGSDVAVQILSAGNGQGAVSARVLGYDANSDVAGWREIAAVAPAAPLRNPEFQAATANYPSSGGDYLLIGSWLYYRGSATDWSEVVAAPPACNLELVLNQALDAQAPGRYVINSAALVNEAPAFLACSLYDGGTGDARRSAVLLLENGGLSQGSTNPVLLDGDEQLSLATTPGSSAGGPSMFVTYPGTAGSFSEAASFTLHQCVGNAVDGAVMHYAVTGFAADNGFDGPQPSAVVPDLDTATCDSSGTVFKYYQCRVYPGGAPQAAPYGHLEMRYRNGLDDQSGDNFYDMLDGLLQEVAVFDAGGAPLTRTSLDWQVWTTRSPDPADAGVAPVRLVGGFVCKTGVTRIADGVSGHAAIDSLGMDAQGQAFQAPWSSQPVAQWSTALGSSGQPETQARATRFGCQRDEVLRALHVLSAPILTTTSVAVADGPQIPLSATAYSRALWPCARGPEILVPGMAGTYAWQGTVPLSYPFDGPDQRADPAGWLCQQRVLARTPLGLVSESADPCGVVTAVHYAGTDSLPVAEITNASTLQDQWAYADFEADDPGDPWQASGAALQAGDAYVGRTSLSLPAGASLAASVTPAGRDPYVLAYALKTPPGYVAGDGAGWSVVVAAGDAVLSTISLPFADSQGVWTWHSAGIELPPEAATPLRVTATAGNPAGPTVLLDAVALAPLHSDLQARSFDRILRQPTASLSAAGRHWLTAYDRQAQAVATLGPDGEVLQLTQAFLSPRGNAAGVFDPASPGASLSLQAAGPSRMELFRAGDEWQAAWDATPAADWQVQKDVLCHAGPDAGTLAWKGWAPTPPATAALFAELCAPQGLGGQLAWALAGGYAVGWDGDADGWFFTGPEGWTAPTLLAHPPAMPLQWLLLFGEGVLLVFGDGQLTYSLDWTAGVPAALTLQTGPNAIEVRNLATMAAPRLSLSYLDGAGTTRQSQSLHGADARLQQSVQDALGRVLASTKPAPARFGQDAALPLMAYHPHLVDVPAFLAATADSWLMQGDVADFYAGQSEGGIIRSNDQGYPYVGTRYEASPRKRVLEAGQPGLHLAIHDLLTLDENERLTTQYRYGNAGDGGYLTRGTLDPHKTLTTSVSTLTRQSIASQISDARGEILNQTTSRTGYRNAQPGPAGQQHTTRLPNAFSPPPQGGADAFVNVVQSDTLDQARAAQAPDSGGVALLYDPAGRWRFLQPALDEGEVWFLYAKYDALGRPVEEGLVLQPWDAAALAAIAAGDPDYPQASDGVPFTISRRRRYDGDGNDPHQIGMPVEVSTWSSDPEAGAPWLAAERFTYDGRGNVTSVALKTALPDMPEAVLGYQYNAIAEVTRLVLPDGAPLGTVHYDYDDLGQVTKISLGDGSELARYAYAISGAVTLEQLNGGQLLQRYAFDSPGWLVDQSLTLAGQEQPAWALAIAHDARGKVCRREETLSLPGSSPEQTETVYEHDALGRLQRAEASGSHAGAWQAQSYDANGNLWAAVSDGATLAFTGVPGSDRLAGASLGEAPAISPAYDARGQLVSAGSLGIAYDPALAMPCGIARAAEDGSAKIRLAYGGQNQRCVKQVAGTAADYMRLYVCGRGTQPLAIWQDGAWTALVMGPAGLTAVAPAGEAVGFVLKDTQSSVRGLVDGGGTLLARYRYGVFGALAENSGPRAAAMPWRFMGQEWDGEAGVYNFKARLYAPDLCRFLQPDPGNQYASPYVFVGNDPVSMADPDGGLGEWAQLGTDALMAAVTIGGLALTPFTGGASDVLMADADATLVLTDVASIGVEGLGTATELGAEGGEEVVESGVMVSQASSDVASDEGWTQVGGSKKKSSSAKAGGTRSKGGGKREGGRGNRGPRKPKGWDKGFDHPESEEAVRCPAQGRDQYGNVINVTGRSNTSVYNRDRLGFLGNQRNNISIDARNLNGLIPQYNGARDAASCAEVNAVVELLNQGVSLADIEVGAPYVRRGGVNINVPYCGTCQDWMHDAGVQHVADWCGFRNHP
ncbi:RHS repeat domain-containing protein [Labrys wisconsinensis]|uniref:RHS repeat-associated protein n=1 Tax=Labrys wisconsinensis TaxID=425677 RepID=A0ABU0J2M3_9HYPH|nr:RHS repeat-associated core domain-containing protein [Labrys wisconsinensis]MDQ0468507.1 RHS repeat-associated protein [Labrys wisconsinensis]